jgi:hypothetical protein
MLTTIPFAGFYGSIHEQELEREEEQMISDSSGCHPVSDRIAEDLSSHVTWPFREYTRAFVEDFQIMLNQETGLRIKLAWESVQSPREYNFATDRVFAEVEFADVQTMFQRVDRLVLDRVAREWFTSCSGFSSYYRSDWRTWGSMCRWDHNQVGAVVAALVAQYFGEDWERNLIEDWSGNGWVAEWLYAGLDTEGRRLVRIADYLRAMEERQWRGAA